MVNIGKQLSKDELATSFGDPEWQAGFFRLLHIGSLLQRSVIASGYRVPDELAKSIYLTPTGTAVRQELVTKHDVPVKEATLMCFLVAVYRDPLVDVERTNYRVLLDEVSKQIICGDIRHPFVHGRELYDKAAELFKDKREYLSVKDSARLLDGSSPGVWQSGNLVTGPFGVLNSLVERTMGPHTDIPLQHCSDPSCQQIHYVRLTTDYEAPINQHRYKLSRLLESGGREPSDWTGFLFELKRSQERLDIEDDMRAYGLPFLIGDALADDELRSLAAYLLDNTAGRFRAVLTRVGIADGAAESMIKSLSRAKLLQLLLCEADDTIVAALDKLVADRTIIVPTGEVRTARINGAEVSGPWRLWAEMGHRGVRMASASRGLPLLRLRRLISDLYDSSTVGEVDDLDWLLRRVEGITAGSKLDDYLWTENPASVVSNLILARRGKAEKAVSDLSISLDPASSSDADFVESVLWKLGFPLLDEASPHERFERRQEEVSRLVRASILSSVTDEEPIRKAASVYFEDLERNLTDSLAFAVWALTTDHYMSRQPFVYRTSVDEKVALEWLNSAQVPDVDQDPGVAFTVDNTLYPLVRGFGILARWLEVRLDDHQEYVRPPSQVPPFANETRLKSFPFAHTLPFLDLLPDSQQRCLAALREVGNLLLKHDVPTVRNDLSHFRRTTVDLARVSRALDAVRSSMKALEAAGFVRVPYSHIATTIDRWGRRSISLEAAGGRRVTFTRPSANDWLGLPNLSEEQYLLHTAVFASPNEVLRFRTAHGSMYEDMWANYPMRRELAAESIAKQSEPAYGSADLDIRGGTRTG